MPENDQRPAPPAVEDPSHEHSPEEDAPELEADPAPEPLPDAASDPGVAESDDPLTGAIPDESTLPDLPVGDDDPAPGEAVQQLVPELEKTGHEAVDAALAALDDLAATSVQDHPAVFEATHEELRRALNDAASAPPPPEN